MKNIKLIGLAAIAALALMASIGAGSASATALCTKQPETIEGKWSCPPGTKLTGSTTLIGSASFGANFQSSMGTMTCKKSALNIPVNLEGNAVVGVLNEHDFNSCGSAIPGCTSTAVTATTKATFEIIYTGKAIAKVIQPRIEMWTECPGFKEPVKCKYGETDTWETQLISGVSGVSNLNWNHVPLTGPGGGLCPTKFEVTALYNTFKYKDASGKLNGFYVAEQ